MCSHVPYTLYILYTRTPLALVDRMAATAMSMRGSKYTRARHDTAWPQLAVISARAELTQASAAHVMRPFPPNAATAHPHPPQLNRPHMPSTHPCLQTCNLTPTLVQSTPINHRYHKKVAQTQCKYYKSSSNSNLDSTIQLNHLYRTMKL